jgi:hypothetical protein
MEGCRLADRSRCLNTLLAKRGLSTACYGSTSRPLKDVRSLDQAG